MTRYHCKQNGRLRLARSELKNTKLKAGDGEIRSKSHSPLQAVVTFDHLVPLDQLLALRLAAVLHAENSTQAIERQEVTGVDGKTLVIEIVQRPETVKA